MHLRPATRDDLADIATVVSQAMIDDELCLWLMPTQTQYPERLRQRSLRTTKRRWNNGLYLIVAVLDEDDPEWQGASKIIGYAAYEKEVGAPDDSSRRKKTFAQGLERTLFTLEENYIWYILNNQYTSKARLSKLLQEARTQDLPQKHPHTWELSILAVNPEFGRRGIGAALIGWGKARATEDNVPLWLQGASPKGQGLYTRQGFKKYGEIKHGNGEDPAPTMIWFPDSPV